METITIAEFATALGLDPKATKEAVLARLTSLSSSPPAGILKKFKLSKKFKSHEEHHELSRQPVRVRVIAKQPIAERGKVYWPEERNERGQVKKPADVFTSDRARLPKIAWAVEEVDKGTPTTEELATKKAA